jgi:hypothetical protein
MRGLLVAVAIALLPLASRAGYDLTTWGMPLAKVRKLYPGGYVATKPNGDVEYRLNKHVGEIENAFVFFRFSSKKLLNEVMIEFPKDGTYGNPKTGRFFLPAKEQSEDRATLLRDHLSAKYGKPASFTKGTMGERFDLWFPPLPDSNNIMLSLTPDPDNPIQVYVQLTYSPKDRPQRTPDDDL